jgi:predicted CoA-binding protein
MGNEWARNLVDDDATIREILRTCRRIAVLGIKTEAQAGQPAIEVPRYLIAQGYDVVPVPVYYPEVARILGRPVYRHVQDIPGGVDLVDVFRRPQDIPSHLDDLLAARPRVVWFQLGIRHDDAARTLAAAGIQVVQDRCTLIEHRRLLGHPLDS